VSDRADDPETEGTRPDIAAVRELKQLISALGDEMAAWRRRAHEAEGRVRDLERTTPTAPPAPAPTSADHGHSTSAKALEAENRELRHRLQAARERTTVLAERLRFLRQQHEQEAGR